MNCSSAHASGPFAQHISVCHCRLVSMPYYIYTHCFFSPNEYIGNRKREREYVSPLHSFPHCVDIVHSFFPPSWLTEPFSIYSTEKPFSIVAHIRAPKRDRLWCTRKYSFVYVLIRIWILVLLSVELYRTHSVCICPCSKSNITGVCTSRALRFYSQNHNHNNNNKQQQ